MKRPMTAAGKVVPGKPVAPDIVVSSAYKPPARTIPGMAPASAGKPAPKAKELSAAVTKPVPANKGILSYSSILQLLKM